MRITINIDEEILQEAKRRARRRGISLGTVFEDALRRDHQANTDRDDRPPLPVFHGTGVHPDIDLASNRAVAEFLDRGRDLSELR